MQSYPMLIAGRTVTSTEQDDVLNPATGQPFATCARATAAQAQDAVAAAARAYRTWRKDQSLRRQRLQGCAAALQAHASDIGRLLTQEQGKPLTAATMEVYGAAMSFTYFASLQVHPEVLQDDGAKRIQVVRPPLGVVAAITPWNFPVLLLAWKRAPALLAGNTVVAKPSEFTPLSSLLVASIFKEIPPTGVINVLAGPGSVGAELASHPDVRKISFTGSVATGKKIMQYAANDLKRVTLELSGNDPATQLGPMSNKMQVDKVVALVEDAKQHGGRIAVGGAALDRPGYFYPPTIVTGLGSGVRLVDEEQFGPALPIIKYRDLDDAIEEANRTPYGLGGSVWRGNLERGEQLVQQLESGTGWVNQHMDTPPFAPFGGCKWSGLG